MQYWIERTFLCPHCGRTVPVLFESTGEVRVRSTGILDERGYLAEREFRHPTVCEGCGECFAAFIRVRFYHHSAEVTVYDTGEAVEEEIGVTFRRPPPER